MRSTKAPARRPITDVVRLGQKQFDQIGCSVCHVSPIVTPAQGTLVNGGAFKVPAAFGNKIVRPFSDFLLHDIGTGDGIPIQAVPEFAATANKMRTAPLWGLRTRNRLMHDGLSFTKNEAIQRHDGQAADVRDAFNALDDTGKAQLMSFLESL